ncbi:LrgB family protein [Fusobacterium animalis]|uniref:LrgB family protein n=1 Tax=Fusobacterium animalis TaxID=76859 RepID=UPI0032431D99
MSEIIQKILFSPFFGIVLSLIAYEIGKYFFSKTKSIFCNPLLIGIILTIIFLMVLNIPFEAYDKGGSIIKIFISPVESVIIGVALYEQFQILKRNWFPILVSTVLGSTFSIIILYILGKVFGLPTDIFHATLPKSVTTAIALDIASKNGWQESLIPMMTVSTGIIGAVIAPVVTKFMKSRVAKGLAMGTASHAVGTAKAIEMGEVEGAMSGLALSLSAISTSFMIPLLLSTILKL